MRTDRPLPRSKYQERLNELDGRCAFCLMSGELLIREYSYWMFQYAAFPYRKYHTLIVSKRHITHFSELSHEELAELAKITREAEALYHTSGVITEDSEFGDQIQFSWRLRYVEDGSKKSVSHLHLHAYPEFGKEINIVLHEKAWDIDVARLR